MNLKEFSEKVENTRADLENKRLDTIHMLLGMYTEMGELSDIFKKAEAYGKSINWLNVTEELGDILWYVVGMCNIHGIDIEDVLIQCVAKLQERYPDKFDQTKALSRDIEAETRAMKSATFNARITDLDKNPEGLNE